MRKWQEVQALLRGAKVRGILLGPDHERLTGGVGQVVKEILV
jgi:hypothetical protein